MKWKKNDWILLAMFIILYLLGFGSGLMVGKINAQIPTSSGLIISGEIEITFVQFDERRHAHLGVVDDGFNYLAAADRGNNIFPTIQEDGETKFFRSRQELKNFLLECGFSYLRTEMYMDNDQVNSVMIFIR